MSRIIEQVRSLVRAPDTSAERERLRTDLERLGQSAKILKAFDIFLRSKKDHEKNLLTARGIGASSATALVAFVQASFDVASGCPRGTEGYSARDCGLSIGSLVSASFGLYGLVVATQLLISGRSHLSDLTTSMDRELANKLKMYARGTPVTAVGAYADSLVSKFAQLSAQDQQEVRQRLSDLVSQPASPRTA